MKKLCAITAALALLCLGSLAQAAITIQTVTVGDPGNAADSTGYGSVGYTYNVGKYEVTAGQYTAFLNAVAKTDTYGLYNTSMDTAVSSYGCNIKRTGTSGNYSYAVASDWANRPVNYVSWGDSARFVNWLHNGQLTGAQGLATTEDGAYFLNGATTDSALNAVTRKAGSMWAITSEDEWYKAAYYKGGSTGAGYWLYPTQSNIAPANQVLATDPGNSANYYINNYSIGGLYYRTNVGEFENSASAYGTFDQGGNVWEWNEAISSGAYRGLRGGSYVSDDEHLRAPSRNSAGGYPSDAGSGVGFRVSQVVPEPASIIALLGGLAGLLGVRRRRR